MTKTRLPVEMVPISGGTFTMGDSSRNGNEKPEHQVTLSAFKMGRYPITQEQYQDVTGKNPSYFQGDSYKPAGGEDQGSRPVENISWLEAIEFCNALSKKEGKTPAYTVRDASRPEVSWDKNADGYRLPTEAEWEYACRAGTATQYSFGNDDSNIDAHAWYEDNACEYTHEVGKNKANPWGLYDMLGNVWEWCWDWYDSYQSGHQTNPDGAVSGNFRVVRGDSWRSSSAAARSAYRGNNSSGDRYGDLGFRLVLP